MIVIETNLKVLPKKCNKCKYSYFNSGDRFCAVSFKDGLNRCCPYEYNEAKRNCEYGKPDWCPLKDLTTEQLIDILDNRVQDHINKEFSKGYRIGLFDEGDTNVLE